jgi:predicted GNAT superfamily acetyltransferase
VPDDIVALRRTDPSLARAWRMALRRAFTDAIAAGYEVSGATRSGWYVLESGRARRAHLQPGI